MKYKDLIGQRFGKLTIISRVGSDKRKESLWLCKCDCGNEKIIQNNCLKSGYTKSCGCIVKEKNKVNQPLAANAQKFEGTKICLIKQGLSIRNKSGTKGVNWSNKHKMWRTQIGYAYKIIDLGYFKNIEDAIKARKEAEEKYFAPVIEEYNQIINK